MFYRKHKPVFAPHSDELITKQEHKEECDINTILKQYQQTGIIAHVQSARPTYEDLPSDVDYQNSMNIILAAQDAFDGLPATVRDFYGNDPEKLLNALGDPAQADRLREFGVLKALPPPPEERAPQPPSSSSSQSSSVVAPPKPE